MKILVLYGFHKEEYDFGKLVCDEYDKIYSPDKAVLVAKAINNSAYRENKIQEKLGYREIMELINEHHPQILIDIHHSKGISLESKQRVNLLLFRPKEKKDGFFINLIYPFFGRKKLETDPHQNNPFEELWQDLSQPLMVNYWNKSVDTLLLDYLSKQTDLGAMPKPNEKIYVTHPRFETATKNNTAYISIEAMLNGENEEVEKDEHYYQTSKKLVELIHRVQEYVCSPPQK